MQIAYFDCFSGISGDMTLGALIDAGAELSLIQAAVASMDLFDVRISVSNTTKRGFRGKLLAIDHPPEHSHRFLRDILSLVRKAKISTEAKDLAMRLFERIARAEAKVHGTTIDKVQFHEVGAIDSIVDIVGVAVAWDMLQIKKAYASPIPTGSGHVRIAHGLVSVPAPATAELLVGVPIAPTQIPMEMTTPTGAAIITELATEFGPMPSMQVGRIGYGAGRKDMPDRPNLLRLLIGSALTHRPRNDDSIVVLESNLDDVTGEQIGFTIDRLWQAGALDVFSIPIQMKKNRPGTLLTVIAKPQDRQTIECILFQQTGTLGIRYRKQARTILSRASIEVATEWGPVRGKVSKLPTGDTNFSPEYDDCSKIATSFGLRLSEVFRIVEDCYNRDSSPTAVDSKFDLANESLGDEAKGNLDNLNAVFRQAAVEDELESIAFETVSADQDRKMESSDAHLAASVWNQNLDSAMEPQQGFYRWDSSPWDSTLVQKLAPLQPIVSTDIKTALPASSEPKQLDQISTVVPKRPWPE
jgi:pyridinium-3,5-bisthiocarboxylic acid mononucleotide nickel chelatase